MGIFNLPFKDSKSLITFLKLVPDLPLEEAYKLSKKVSNHSMDLILLVAPTTPFERMKQISNHTKGFT